MTWQERLWSKVAPPNEDGCWLWTGPLFDGYGSFYGAWDVDTSRKGGPHRWAYIATHGSIPRGLHIDHLCNVRSCCNPDHLEPVTASENMRRAHARRKAVSA